MTVRGNKYIQQFPFDTTVDVAKWGIQCVDENYFCITAKGTGTVLEVIDSSDKELERGTAKEIFDNAKHPYTWALLSSIPKASDKPKSELYALKGTPPDLILPLNECPFASRCEYCMQICKEQNPAETKLSDTHSVACWLQHPGAPKVKSFYDKQKEAEA